MIILIVNWTQVQCDGPFVGLLPEYWVGDKVAGDQEVRANSITLWPKGDGFKGVRGTQKPASHLGVIMGLRTDRIWVIFKLI